MPGTALDTNDYAFLSRLVSAMENDIIPLTRRGVEAGNEVFGAAGVIDRLQEFADNW